MNNLHIPQTFVLKVADLLWFRITEINKHH